MRFAHLGPLLFCLSATLLVGCQKRGAAEKFGKTYYLDGAGNWGFGASSVPEGLRMAGYNGDVELYVWTSSLFPLIDQLNIPAAKLRASLLARKIEDHHERYPDNLINVVALSAGTGVATWAIEELSGGAKVHNLILLGSSLSHNYDLRRALRNITGRVYVYFSPQDNVLQSVRVIGTIDGGRGVDAAGSVGLRPPAGMRDRIVNIGWTRRWLRYGWAGAHTDCVNQTFVRYEIARHIVQQRGKSIAPARTEAESAVLYATAPAPDPFTLRATP